MAMALYRTYRPGSLAEVIGQEHVTGPLARALDAGRVHHAYLLSGPRGCGKTSTARILARSLNCASGPSSAPCGTCRSCQELAPNGPGSVDVIEMDAATHRSVEDARDLREKAIYAPAADRYKVYIIDEAHQLTSDAANALLKLIEEPPPHLRFIFATTEPDKIIPTIRSRTFHYSFRLVPSKTLVDHLARVCAAESIPAEGPALAVVARAGSGSVRDSLSVLGQLLAGVGPQGLTYDDAISALGLTGGEAIDEFVGAVAAGSAARMFRLVDSVVSAGQDPRRFVVDALDRLRDLIILRVDPAALESGAVDVPPELGQHLLTQSQSLGLAELSRAADLVSAGLTDIRGATAPRLQLELLCARLALATETSDVRALVARIERLERSTSVSASQAGGPGQPSPADAGAATRRPVSRETSGDPAQDAPGEPVRSSGPSARSAPTTPDPSAAHGTPGPRPPQPERVAPPRRPSLRSEARDAGSGGGEPAAAGRTSPTPSAPGERSGPPDAVTAEGRPPGEQGMARLQASWVRVLEHVGRASRVARSAFDPSKPLSLREEVLAVAVEDVGRVRIISQRGFDELLRHALIDVLGLDVTVEVLLDPDRARMGGPSAASGALGSPEQTTGGGERGAAPQPGRQPQRPAGTPTGNGAADSPAAASSGWSGAPRSPGATPAASPVPSGPSAPVRAPAAMPASEPAAGRAGSDRPSRASQVMSQVRAQRSQDPDEPSPDDPNLTEMDGLALITRELGARPIGEIDHT